MSERPQLAPALGLVRDRVSGPPPRRAATAVPQQTPAIAATPAAAQTSPVESVTVDERKPKKAPARIKASDRSTGGTKKTSVTITQATARNLRDKLNSDRKVTQIQFILSEVEKNASKLKDLVEKEKGNAGSGGGGLFPDATSARNTGEEMTTINLVTTEANLAVLDSLAESTGAESRSQLIRAALRPALDN
ncbi:hypothetical protein GCM10011584_35300 [Nocardioides phosphati]|uniref:Uncharacterized protein n=1 Tax=Nocardioides phosphati TaxID=1867775 RepID=A0ABQ2NG88_9ACTN|nr:ribbon-helix-helix protein, CopG family [Nocardioides phosphati]GGO94387.1 hypothetical protein GCM10011584_35300 [Nocardioides phosphati]